MPIVIEIQEGGDRHPKSKREKLSDQQTKSKRKKLSELYGTMNPIRDKPKKKKKPTGTKGGKGKPARTEKPGVPHGVDKKDSEGVTILEVATGGDVHPPKKKRGNYGPNIGKPFKAMGPVGGLPVNKSGTKIMAGRLAKRGYGKAR